jgi:phenylacetate-CoA ligase
MVGLYWNVLTLRDHVWHRRDLSQKLAIVREGSTHARADSWGVATMGLVDTGPAVSNSIHTDAAELLEWLLTERPGYLFTYPSLLAELARLALARQARMPELLEVRTVSEALGPELRDLCREAWGVPLVDSYSSSEAGYMALQCPEYEHYHVQSEGVLLEVLDERNRPCGPGEVGRVVVTPLHNFATPLIRYDIGDYAEVGKPCDCGRGLPVLKRVLGRVRNTLVTADGKRYWPLFGTRELTDKLPLLQHQFVQKTVELVEARLVVGRPLSAAEEQMIIARVQSKLPAGMRVELSYVEQLARSASGKFEDFISEVAEASAPSR